jgi:hypothetical protein
MKLDLTFYEAGPDYFACFEDRATDYDYWLTWVPGSRTRQPRICVLPRGVLPKGIRAGDVLVAMEAA